MKGGTFSGACCWGRGAGGGVAPMGGTAPSSCSTFAPSFAGLMVLCDGIRDRTTRASGSGSFFFVFGADVITESDLGALRGSTTSSVGKYVGASDAGPHPRLWVET